MPGKDRKRWTVLIYMVADDPQGGELLDRLAVREMDQITKATLSVKNPERSLRRGAGRLSDASRGMAACDRPEHVRETGKQRSESGDVIRVLRLGHSPSAPPTTTC